MKTYEADVTLEGSVYVARIEELRANTEAESINDLKIALIDAAWAAGAAGDFVVKFHVGVAVYGIPAGWVSHQREHNPILRAFDAAVAAGDPYADAESWRNNLSDFVPESDAHAYSAEDIAFAESEFARISAETGSILRAPDPQ